LQIDLTHTDNGNGASPTSHALQPLTQSHSLEPIAVQTSSPAGFEPNDESAVSTQIVELLKSHVSTDRAAALTDLAEVGGDEAFDLITQSFDDPAIEVRNAAARALHDMSHDRASSFTRALREATPER